MKTRDISVTRTNAAATTRHRSVHRRSLNRRLRHKLRGLGLQRFFTTVLLVTLTVLAAVAISVKLAARDAHRSAPITN